MSNLDDSGNFKPMVGAGIDAEPAKRARKDIDWEAIERDYRAGILSIREVGRLHGVSDKAIRNKAEAMSWDRDLAAKVAEKVRNELVRSESAVADKKQTEKEIVDVAAATVVAVVIGQRKRYGKLRTLADGLTEQLEEVIACREEIEEDIEAMTAEDRDSKRRARMLRAVSLGEHITDFVNLANAERIITGLERDSFGMKNNNKEDDQKPTTYNMSF